MNPPEKLFDVIVLGGGSAGYACALRCAQLDLAVALVERSQLGGTCLHSGCIPTKAFLQAGAVADSVREAARFGVVAEFGHVDMAAVSAFKNKIVTTLAKGLAGLIEAHQVTYINGVARLVGPTSVAVGDDIFAARSIVVATGSAPNSLPGVDVDGTRVITSDHAVELDRVPRSAIILGGGVIGVEFASIFRSFGADVSVVEALPQLLPAEDVACSKLVERAFRRRKIAVRVNARIASAEAVADGVRVVLESGQSMDAEVLLVAVGRGPRTAELGLERVGVRTDRGYVTVDDELRTNVPSVFAAGDVVAGMQLAHRGFQHGIFVAEQIAGLAPTPFDELSIPRVAYCEPEVASVGYSETAAAVHFGDSCISTSEHNLGANGRSQIRNARGFVKTVRLKDGPVVGVHMAGEGVGELIGEAQVVVSQRLAPEALSRFIHAHPTQSEALGETYLALAGKPLHGHR